MEVQKQALKARMFLEFLKGERRKINREVDQQELKVMKLEAQMKKKEASK